VRGADLIEHRSHRLVQAHFENDKRKFGQISITAAARAEHGKSRATSALPCGRCIACPQELAVPLTQGTIELTYRCLIAAYLTFHGARGARLARGTSCTKVYFSNRLRFRRRAPTADSVRPALNTEAFGGFLG